jgi:hypothetical protein
MLIAVLTLVTAAALAQAGTPPQSPATPELPVLDAKLGGCSADFTVKGEDGKPVYLALINVRVRYGTLGIRRMDLEVGTNSEGKARIKGLPDKARLMTYAITKDDKKTEVDQDVEKTCAAKLDVTLK